MRYFMLFLLFFFLSCCDCDDSLDEGCDTACKSWETCVVDTCELRKGYCGEDADCKDGNLCNKETHQCEESILECQRNEDCLNAEKPVCDAGKCVSRTLSFSFDFNQEAEGWIGGFADYPVADEAIYDLLFEHNALPEPLDTTLGALKQSGNNHSDDLFMFIKKKITNLEPNHEYTISFDVWIASNAPDDSFGVGGSPGSSVTVKAGASLIEPNKVVNGEYYRMNIDKANQTNSGKDMMVIGDFANGTTEAVYALKQLQNDTFKVTTDEKGELWLILGTDSGFESTTTIYYHQVNINFQ